MSFESSLKGIEDEPNILSYINVYIAITILLYIGIFILSTWIFKLRKYLETFEMFYYLLFAIYVLIITVTHWKYT